MTNIVIQSQITCSSFCFILRYAKNKTVILEQCFLKTFPMRAPTLERGGFSTQRKFTHTPFLRKMFIFYSYSQDSFLFCPFTHTTR